MHSILTDVLSRARAAIVSRNIATTPRAEVPQVGLSTELSKATRRPDADELPAPRLHVQVIDKLTNCLNFAPCPATAQRIYRLLFELGLESIRSRGLPRVPDVAVFHLPVELLAAYLGVSRETVWRNVKSLKAAGILDERDHYSTLRGQTSVSGKVWAISLRPERHLSGQVQAVRLKIDDLKFAWRNLDADALAGRTAYALTRGAERQAQDAEHRAAQSSQRAEANERARARRTERIQDQRSGRQPLRGRAAATANAAETRAGRPAQAPKARVQQSNKKTQEVEKSVLVGWTLSPFLPHHDVTLTVAPGGVKRPVCGLDTIHSLPSLAGLDRKARSKAVEDAARRLAATFEDADNLRFWLWLLWQLLRGHDQGQDWTEDVTHVLARVYQDLRHDESMDSRAARNPGALVAADLRTSGLLDALRSLAPMRVGTRPAA